MKITITTSPKNVEMANFLLAQAYKEAIKSPKWMKYYKTSKVDLRKAEAFRESLLKAFLNPPKP